MDALHDQQLQTPIVGLVVLDISRYVVLASSLSTQCSSDLHQAKHASRLSLSSDLQRHAMSIDDLNQRAFSQVIFTFNRPQGIADLDFGAA